VHGVIGEEGWLLTVIDLLAERGPFLSMLSKKLLLL
jgi:hypothetical protein